jgi:tryptophan synthase alpha chain
MGRIDAALRGRKKPAFIGFTVAGDPDKETCIRAAMALIDGVL